MHHIYHTEALIIGSKNTGEADRSLFLYTDELGLVKALAQGIRLEKSKLRFALQDFSHASVDLVRGKHSWRITSASILASFPNATVMSYSLLKRVARLIARLCVDEEKNKNIFDDFLAVLRFLDQRVNASEQSETELCVVLRILHHLGYIGNTDTFAPLLSGAFDPGRAEYQQLEKKTLLFEINRAIKESHL